MEKTVLDSKSVLIVDDDFDTCNLLANLFDGSGFQPSLAHNGFEALDHLQDGDADIVLLDVMMPEMDGFETYERLREFTDIPVIFLTALDSGESASRALSLGAQDYVRKPFHHEELLGRVRAALANGLHVRTNGGYGEEGQEQGAKAQIVASIVVPTYNEESALPLVLDAIYEVIDASYEVVVVDDGSTDRSAEIASTYPCRLIVHPNNMGKGAALRTGLEQAEGEKVLFIDADNTYPVELIPPMVKLMDEYDLVRGVRSSGRQHIPWLNRMGNNIFDWVIRLIHAVEGGDLLSGMYGGCRHCLQELDLESAGFDIEAEIGVKAKAHGFAVGTIPISYVERVGEKKLKAFQDGMRILYRVMQLAVTYNPLFTFIIPGMFMFFTALVGLGLLLFDTSLSQMILAVHGELLLGIFATVGLQLMIFGLAVYIAGMAYGLRGRANRMLDQAIQTLNHRTAKAVGLVLSLSGSVGILWLIGYLLVMGVSSFEMTMFAVFASLFTMVGFQILSSIAFFSALKGLVHPSIYRRMSRYFQ